MRSCRHYETKYLRRYGRNEYMTVAMNDRNYVYFIFSLFWDLYRHTSSVSSLTNTHIWLIRLSTIDWHHSYWPIRSTLRLRTIDTHNLTVFWTPQSATTSLAQLYLRHMQDISDSGLQYEVMSTIWNEVRDEIWKKWRHDCRLKLYIFHIFTILRPLSTY